MRLCHQGMSRTVQIGNAACKSVSPLLHWTPMPNSVPYRGADIVITRMHRPTTYNLTIMLPTTVLICIQESLIRQHIHCAPTQGECLNAFRNVYRFPHGEASVPPSNSNPCLQPDRSPWSNTYIHTHLDSQHGQGASQHAIHTLMCVPNVLHYFTEVPVYTSDLKVCRVWKAALAPQRATQYAHACRYKWPELDASALGMWIKFWFVVKHIIRCSWTGMETCLSPTSQLG